MKEWKLIFSDRSLRYKFALSSVLPIMIVTVFIVIITINSLEKSIMEKTRIRAQGLTKLSALSMSNSFVIYNKDLLDNFVDSLAIERNIIYAMVVDSSDGRILAHSDHTHDGKIFSDSIGNDSLSTEQITSAIIAEKEHGEMYELFTPVIVRGIQYGVVGLGFSLEEVHEEIAFMKSEIMTIGALGIILGILSSIFFPPNFIFLTESKKLATCLP